MDETMKPDILAGLNRGQRRRREQADLDFIARNAKVFAQSHQQTDLFDMRKDPPSIAVCERIDLDHPRILADNLLGQCADCGCDIQYRPVLPAGMIRVCICCAARRVREASPVR